MRIKVVSSVIVLASHIAMAQAAAPAFVGVLTATFTRGGAGGKNTLYFTRQGDQLRIENASDKLEPVNILDLAANRLTIVYPHNQSFVVVDLARAETAPAPNLPTSLPMTSTSSIAGPNIPPPPGLPTPPSMPTLPNKPSIGPPANSTMPRMPNNIGPSGAMIPPMPPMGSMDSALELKKTDQTKKIQGFDCTLYTLADRLGTMEIWATSDATLFPFRLPQSSYHPRHFGPVMLEEEWPELLQKKSLFPLEATLRTAETNQARLSFKVEKIDQARIDPAKADALFKPPDNYQESPAPQL